MTDQTVHDLGSLHYG